MLELIIISTGLTHHSAGLRENPRRPVNSNVRLRKTRHFVQECIQMSVKVTQCLVSLTTKPKFTADIGDTVLIKSEYGYFGEVEIISINGSMVEVIGPTGTSLTIPEDSVLAVCM